jgi:hypothetical protein
MKPFLLVTFRDGSKGAINTAHIESVSDSGDVRTIITKDWSIPKKKNEVAKNPEQSPFVKTERAALQVIDSFDALAKQLEG